MDVYDLGREKPGYCVVFNHLSYSADFPGGPPRKRKGTDEDVAAILKTFNKLGFQSNYIQVVQDGTKKEIFDTIKQVFSSDWISQFGSIFVFILTHGTETLAEKPEKQLELFAQDQRYIFRELFDEAMESASPTLAGKPKMFIIQACSGGKRDYGIDTSSDNDDESSQSEMAEDTEVAKAAIAVCPLLLPDQLDVLLVFASPPGYRSFRNWLIQELCQSIEDCGQKYDMEKILTLTRGNVAIKVPRKGELRKQIPMVISTLTKHLRLPSNVDDAAQ